MWSETLAVLAWNAAGLAGGALIAVGAWLAYPPAGFILGGIMLLAGAVILSPRGDGARGG